MPARASAWVCMGGHLARRGALVLSDLEGGHPHPERFWRTWKATVARCRAALGEDAPPVITIHDLRHTHASLLLRLASRSRQPASGWAMPASPSP